MIKSELVIWTCGIMIPIGICLIFLPIVMYLVGLVE